MTCSGLRASYLADVFDVAAAETVAAADWDRLCLRAQLLFGKSAWRARLLADLEGARTALAA